MRFRARRRKTLRPRSTPNLHRRIYQLKVLDDEVGLQLVGLFDGGLQ
jgi:hypothetical protein